MYNLVKKTLKRYFSLSDIESLPALVMAGVITLVAAFFSIQSVVQADMSSVQAFLLCVIGGAIGLLGITISGVAIVIALFSAKDIDLINKFKEGAFQELLNDFKFLAFHIAVGVIAFCLMYFSGYFILTTIIARIGTYCCIFYVSHFIVFTTLYCASLVGNCVKLSILKQTLYHAETLEKSLFEQTNELISERLVAMMAKTHGFSMEDFFVDLIQNLEKSNLANKSEIIEYLQFRYHISG